MAVLYPNYLLCSIRFYAMPLTFSLQSLSFTQLRPLSLSSSSSLPSRPSLNLISDLLTKECGFSSSQVTTVMRTRAELLRTKSDHTAREAIHILRDSGFTEYQLKRTILHCPVILTLKVDVQLKAKMEFLKNLGVAPQDMPHIISRSPRVLTLSIENNLAPRILHLETLFGSKGNLCKVLRRMPEFLLSDIKKHVMPRVEYVKNNLGIEGGSKAFARALSDVLCFSFENVENKTKNLASLGLTEEEIRLILRSNTKVLMSSTKKIKENMDFLIHTAGLTPNIVASRPLILNFSVEKTIKPRYEYFKYLRRNPLCKCLPSLIIFLALSDKVFLKRFGQYSPQVKSDDHTIS